MAAIIEKQHVAKRVASQRQKNPTFKPINKSAGFNAGFMGHFSQKPAYKKKKRSAPSPSLSFPSFSSIKGLIKERMPRHSRKPSYKKREKKVQGTGFSFPVPSLSTLAVIAGTVVIALAALNWEDLNIKTPERYAFQLAEDTEAERHTMRYAATGITGIMPAQRISPENESPAMITGITGSPESTEAGGAMDGSIITFKWQPYRVQRGDSVSAIAQKFEVSVGAIIASNDIRNARTLREGTTLRIPNIDGIPYQIKSGDSLVKIAASYNVPLEVILDVNDIKSDNIIAGETIFIPGARMNDIDLRLSLGELFIYPVQSRVVTSPYGMRRDPISGALNFHTGIDLRADTGTTVMAALDGVISVVSENWLYGKYIIMTHDNGYKTLYAHLNSYAVRQGERVARGRKIAESGNTGYSTGPHLHFSIYDRNNRLVNPLELLR
jgi:murein DD-endopeptidase MepM/ murein hydrolase activator NlpD